MYTLHIRCPSTQAEFASADLWEAGTVAIRQIDNDSETVLIAAYESNDVREDLLRRFALYSPHWQHEPATDWVQQTIDAWPGRAIGERIFLAPVWSDEPTPPGRRRIVHNPGLACGTGEHPCTQLALLALEKIVTSETRLVDVGTGSGLLAIAALRLGAQTAVGIDPDVEALQAARENFELNGLAPTLAAGSADCISDGFADMTAANINASVLLSIWDDLLRITRPNGTLILTGFTDAEAHVFQRLLPESQTLGLDDWRCVQSLQGRFQPLSAL